jgi:ATP adenylyltransferase
MAKDWIWAPWRLRYLRNASRSDECIFCAKPEAGADRESLIAHRGERCFVMLNLFPYTNGHLMVAPFEHVGATEEIGSDVMAEMMALAQRGIRILTDAYEPEGFNLGINQGRVAGAGVEGHIHLHIVPRWAGDTNFMTTVNGVRVIPEELQETYRLAREHWPGAPA